MQYMLLIAEPRGQRTERGVPDGEAVYAQMLAYAATLQHEGVLRAGEALQSDDNAVRVQVRAGQQRTLDGPFIESKEMIGGFFIVDCATQDQAIALAARCPAAAWATVEVRALGPCFT